MVQQKGYYKDDLKIYINRLEKRENRTAKNKYPPTKHHIYKFFVLIEGEAQVQLNSETFKIKDYNMVFADTNDYFAYNFDFSQNITYLDIMFHPSLLSGVFGDDEFLRAPQKMPDKKRMIDLNDEKFLIIRQMVDDIVKCIEKNAERSHYLTRLCAIISELDFYYDDIIGDDKVYKENLPLTLVQYVNHNYSANITYDLLCDKFFISKPTAIKIFKSMTGMTMHEYLEDIRLRAAKRLIFNEGVNTAKAAKMCGYEYYSTFVRAYKRKYGILPKNDKQEWPVKYSKV